MKKKIAMFLSCILTLMTLTSCAQRETQDTENLKAVFESDNSLLVESSGSIGFGYLNPPENGYVYDGTDVRIPYYIENDGSKNEPDAKVGLMFFVDGEVQQYSIATSEGNKESDLNSFHFFSLAPGERQEFEAIFKPVSGMAGDEVGVIPAIIWNPEYMPESGKIANFGNCYSLNSNIPLYIQMQENGTGEQKASSLQYNIMDIPEDILLSLEGQYSNDVYDYLDSSVGFEIETDNKRILYSDNGKVEVTINLYGGKEVADKITLFVGNQPIKIEDGDYVQVNTQKGKMCQIKATIDVSELKNNSVLYAIVMTNGNDYLVQDIYITDPVLIEIE